MSTLPEPLYKIGDVVYRVQAATTRGRHPCPDCNDTKEWIATSPLGVTIPVGCPRCTQSHGYGRETLSLDYTKHTFYTERLTIRAVRMDTAQDPGEVFCYMAEETSSGRSGSLYYERDLFADEPAANAQAEIDTKLRQAENDATPQAQTKFATSKLGCLDALTNQLRAKIHQDVMDTIRNEFGMGDGDPDPDINDATPGAWHVGDGGFGDDGVYRFSIEAEQFADSYPRSLTVCNGYGGLCDGWATKEQGPANAALIASAPALKRRNTALEQALPNIAILLETVNTKFTDNTEGRPQSRPMQSDEWMELRERTLPVLRGLMGVDVTKEPS